MATPPIDSIDAQLSKQGLKGFLNATPAASTPIYSDSSGNMQAGSIPFVFPLAAGSTSTAYSVASITGQATGSADELMHLTLVKGANATSTIAGFYRITVTDSAGVIVSGDYYAPFYTLA